MILLSGRGSEMLGARESRGQFGRLPERLESYGAALQVAFCLLGKYRFVRFSFRQAIIEFYTL